MTYTALINVLEKKGDVVVAREKEDRQMLTKKEQENVQEMIHS
jgi:hypothetical protein